MDISKHKLFYIFFFSRNAFCHPVAALKILGAVATMINSNEKAAGMWTCEGCCKDPLRLFHVMNYPAIQFFLKIYEKNSAKDNQPKCEFVDRMRLVVQQGERARNES